MEFIVTFLFVTATIYVSVAVAILTGKYITKIIER
jgi:hypothetical protein